MSSTTSEPDRRYAAHNDDNDDTAQATQAAQTELRAWLTACHSRLTAPSRVARRELVLSEP